MNDTTENNDYEDRYRVCNTHDLVRLNRAADNLHLNRSLALEKIDLDPDGNHVLEMVLFGHNMDQSEHLHHRARVLIKEKGVSKPLEGFLDILDADWVRLHKVGEVMAD